MRPRAPGRARPPRLCALRSGHRVRPAGGVHDADPGVHHPDPGVHDAPILAFTIVRSARSRSREIRSRDDDRRRLVARRQRHHPPTMRARRRLVRLQRRRFDSNSVGRRSVRPLPGGHATEQGDRLRPHAGHPLGGVDRHVEPVSLGGRHRLRSGQPERNGAPVRRHLGRLSGILFLGPGGAKGPDQDHLVLRPNQSDRALCRRGVPRFLVSSPARRGLDQGVRPFHPADESHPGRSWPSASPSTATSVVDLQWNFTSGATERLGFDVAIGEIELW